MNFTVYTKDNCPYCSKIKQVLSVKGLNFVAYKLGVDFEKKAFYDQFGEGSTFPQVVLNNQNLGGCTDAVKYLAEKNII
jgi:glutaredoxin|tara:strand:- start:78 stop:314 length:237 start_codon:yes stop_codon:yes gene_type:complete